MHTLSALLLLTIAIFFLYRCLRLVYSEEKWNETLKKQTFKYLLNPVCTTSNSESAPKWWQLYLPSFTTIEY